MTTDSGTAAESTEAANRSRQTGNQSDDADGSGKE